MEPAHSLLRFCFVRFFSDHLLVSGTSPHAFPWDFAVRRDGVVGGIGGKQCSEVITESPGCRVGELFETYSGR
jgi:hypothetical protein